MNATAKDKYPFKDQMRDFFESAESLLKAQVEKMESSQEMFEKLLKYFSVKDTEVCSFIFLLRYSIQLHHKFHIFRF